MRIRRYVYAAYRPKSREIKIGCSVAPILRMRELGSGRRDRVMLLAEIPGDKEKERRFHIRLRDHRSRRYSKEWFKRTPEVLLAVSEMMFVDRALKPTKEKSVA